MPHADKFRLQAANVRDCIAVNRSGRIELAEALRVPVNFSFPIGVELMGAAQIKKGGEDNIHGDVSIFCSAELSSSPDRMQFDGFRPIARVSWKDRRISGFEGVSVIPSPLVLLGIGYGSAGFL
ncbi:MAG: hypothetical protein M9945_17475 [Aquamicrobium sp.]|uniref:hypothetical protein n=1 Tax=Aquamicrobium sp. TaxID=1872579 RepID=UPI00349EFA10|nr:hypothetical protein [Aquamicrobium sp.]